MTIEEKAKAYDKAIERAKEVYDGKGEWNMSDLYEIQPALKFIFSELAESEDERIRNEILEYFTITHSRDFVANPEKQKWISYIKKQKEHTHMYYSYDDKLKAYSEGQKEVVNNPEIYGLQKIEEQKNYKEEIEKCKENPLYFYDKYVKIKINWAEFTWKDIIELEGIINNVRYEFRNGIGQESFGKEVLERFRATKGIEYLDDKKDK